MKPSSVKIERKNIILPTLNKRDYTADINSGETLIWYIPSLANSVMQGDTAYLRFTVSITNRRGGNNSFRLDNGAWSFFQSLRVYGPGGSLLEEITDLNVLYNALCDTHSDMSSKAGLSTGWGFEENNSPATVFTGTNAEIRGAVADAAATADLLNARLTTIKTNRTGYGFGTVANNATVTATFSIPILSGLFSLSEKCWPCWALQDDTRIELQLARLAQALVCGDNPANANGTVLTISNPEIVVDYLFFQPESMQMIQSVYAGRDLVLHATTYRNYQSTITAGTTGNIQSILPCKVVSAKLMLGVFRFSAHTTAYNAYSLSSRVCPFSSSTDRYNLSIGGQVLPQNGISTNIDNFFDTYFSELQKAFHAWGVNDINGNLTRSYYNVNAQAVGDTAPAPADELASYRNGVLLGVNLDSVLRSSELILSGMDLSKVSSYHEYRIRTGPAQNITVNTFILHDVLFVVDANGTMIARF